MSVYPDPEGLAALGEQVAAARPNEVLGWYVAFGELTLNISAPGIVALVEHLRADPSCRFSTLVDITAVDHPDRPARFDMVWQFLSMYSNQRIRIKAEVREDELVPSLIGKSRAAGWRVELRGTDAARMARLDDLLWQGEGFLPHGLAGGPHDALQPVLLTVAGQAGAGAPCLIALDGAAVDPAEMGPGDRGGALLRTGPPGTVVRRRHAQVDHRYRGRAGE